MRQHFTYGQAFFPELGGILAGLDIAYHTYGTLNPQKNNVIWVCHALTANADAADWWPGMIGPGLAMDTDRYFVVCANIIGSCYGSTGPLSERPETGSPYFHDFPALTIRDMVKAHILLRQHLGIDRILLLAGGSMGGYQVLEWALAEPECIERLFLLATSAAESPWGIAIHTTQRLAIAADDSWKENTLTAGAKGLKAARAVGMLSYRNYRMFEQQKDPDNNKTDDYKVSAYIHYQGDKLVNRFNAYSYWVLGKAMDSHNISRGRAMDTASALAAIRQPVLLMGISSDMLCPVPEQQFMATHLPDVVYHEIDSAYGHDGFLTESGKISERLQPWLEQQEKG